MPLIHSKSDSAFKANVKTLVGEIGKSPHVKDQRQALAIAYATKRRGRATGGPIQGFALGGPQAPWQVKAEARGMMHTGPINSVVPGRTDNHKMSVPGGAYVFTADHVSHLGQNNTNAGQAVLSHMFGQSGPYGMGHDMGIKHGPGAPHPPALGKIPADAGGSRGTANVGKPVDVMTAGGEFVATPENVLAVARRFGHPGDMKMGHAILDAWQKIERERHVKTLKRLPGPAKG